MLRDVLRWLQPGQACITEKRRLEQIAIEAGASRSTARRIVRRFFNELSRPATPQVLKRIPAPVVEQPASGTRQGRETQALGGVRSVELVACGMRQRGDTKPMPAIGARETATSRTLQPGRAHAVEVVDGLVLPAGCGSSDESMAACTAHACERT